MKALIYFSMVHYGLNKGKGKNKGRTKKVELLLGVIISRF